MKVALNSRACFSAGFAALWELYCLLGLWEQFWLQDMGAEGEVRKFSDWDALECFLWLCYVDDVLLVSGCFA